jgi:DSF synthase
LARFHLETSGSLGGGTPHMARFDARHLIGHARPASVRIDPPGPVPAHVQVASERYAEVEVSLDPQTRTYWCSMAPNGRPSFTQGLLRDLAAMQRSIRQLCARAGSEDPIRYFVVESRLNGIFNLGGDLELFASCIRRRDREGLLRYALACVGVVHENAVAYGQRIVTIALVQGDALGGGFEAALSCDVIIAERSAKFGFPEILFNLFPGMGAYSLLSRRLDGARAEKMILSGRIYTADELHAMGLIEQVVEDGKGQQAVREYVSRATRRHNGQSALSAARRMVQPLPLDELRAVTELWVDAALRVSDLDLRKMSRLTAAQGRRSPSPMGETPSP